MSEAPISEAFVLLAELAQKDGIASARDFEACWERQIGEHWWIALNAHKEAKPQTHSDAKVEPFHCYLEFNGWPAGIINPYGGIIAAGDAANEDAFISAIQAELR